MPCSSGGPDKKFDAVLKRVHAQQEAQDKANTALQASKAATVSMLIPDAKVDWSKFRLIPTSSLFLHQSRCWSPMPTAQLVPSIHLKVHSASVPM